MDERNYIAVKIRLSRGIDNLKDALQMFSALASHMDMDEIDDLAMDEGEVVKALCMKVAADIDALLSYSE